MRARGDDAMLQVLYGAVMMVFVLIALAVAAAGYSTFQQLVDTRGTVDAREDEWSDALRREAAMVNDLRALEANLTERGKLIDSDLTRAAFTLGDARRLESTLRAAREFEGAAERVLSVAETDEYLAATAVALRRTFDAYVEDADTAERRYLEALDAYNEHAEGSPGRFIGPFMGYERVAHPTFTA